MVRANGANANSEIRTFFRTFFSPHPPAQTPTFNAPFPAAGGGLGCALAIGPARGARRLGGRVRRCAPSKGISGRRPAAGATLTRSVGDDRSSPNPGKPGGASAPPTRVNDRRRQGPRAKISGEDR
jgi:hypothetical protein